VDSLRVPSVSVALCTYNGERFIEEQLHTILAQDVPALEVVVSDDGSSDGTVSIIRAIASSETGSTSVRLAHTDRVGGVARNFDRTIAACRGDIIALSDQDDLWDPGRLGTIVGILAAKSMPSLVFADAVLIDSRGELLGGTLQQSLRLSRSERVRLDQGRPFEALIRRNIVTGAVSAFTRDLYELSTPFPELWVHDEWLAIMAAGLGTVIRSTDHLGAYRLHDANQIGVPEVSVRARLQRMLAPRVDRYERFRDRSTSLLERLESRGASEAIVTLAQRKVAFETARALYPKGRLARVCPVIARLLRGDYRRLASQGGLDAIRDLVQPA
jgi:glycosyltransferase involved in cell wall biosynthesis